MTARHSSEFPLIDPLIDPMIDNVVGRRTSNNPVATAIHKRRPL